MIHVFYRWAKLCAGKLGAVLIRSHEGGIWNVHFSSDVFEVPHSLKNSRRIGGYIDTST